MNLVLMIYLVEMLGQANVTLSVLTIITTLLFLVGLGFSIFSPIVFRSDEDDNRVRHTAYDGTVDRRYEPLVHTPLMDYLKYTKKLLTVLMFLMLLGVVLPTKNTAYTMLAAYGVTEVAQSERVQELAGNSLELLNQKIGSYLKQELKEVTK